MTKESFIEKMKMIIESGKEAAIYVQIYGNEEVEIRTIGNKDLKNSLEYFCCEYDENMNYKYTADDISIKDVKTVIMNEIPVGEKTVKIFMHI